MLAVMRLATILVALSSSFLAQVAQIDRPAPQLALEDLEGRTLRLADYKGKVVLLNFWATWCAPCRAEIPDLIKWQREYKERGLQVLGVAYPPVDLTEVRAFIREMGVDYPILIGDEAAKAQFDKGETLPLTVVIDRRGRVRDIIQGILFAEEFEEKIRPLLE